MSSVLEFMYVFMSYKIIMHNAMEFSVLVVRIPSQLCVCSVVHCFVDTNTVFNLRISLFSITCTSHASGSFTGELFSEPSEEMTWPKCLFLSLIELPINDQEP